jgi:hypothetical protein
MVGTILFEMMEVGIATSGNQPFASIHNVCRVGVLVRADSAVVQLTWSNVALAYGSTMYVKAQPFQQGRLEGFSFPPHVWCAAFMLMG